MLRTSQRANQVWYLLYLDLKSKKFSESTGMNINIQTNIKDEGNNVQHKNCDNKNDDDKQAEVDDDNDINDDARADLLSLQPSWGCKTAAADFLPSGCRPCSVPTSLAECDGSGRSQRTASTLT